MYIIMLFIGLPSYALILSELFLSYCAYQVNEYTGLAGFGQSGKNHPFWTGLNRPVQNLSIVQNCPKLSKTPKKAGFH